MSNTTDEFDALIAQVAYHDTETFQEVRDTQRFLTEGLLLVAQYETDDPEKREILDELEEQAREFGLISSNEDECSCNCSCSSASPSSSSSALESLNELVETNGEDTDTDADPGENELESEPELNTDAPGKILNTAAAEAANDTDTNADDEPSSGSLREYRERQANAAEDAEDVDGTPASLSAWRKTEDGKQATKQKEDRRPSLMDLLRAP